MTKICILVDMLECGDEPNGSFGCGKIDDPANKIAIQVIDNCQKIVTFVDVHPKKSNEFVINGGLYPIHALVNADLSFAGEKNASCRVTKLIREHIQQKGVKGGIVLPNSVQYQEPEDPLIPEQVRETFDNYPIIESPEDNQYDYMISCKHFFNGAALENIPYGDPKKEFTAATVLQYQYGKGKDVTFYVCGHCSAICVFHTASGLKQLFPEAKVVVVKDTCYPLIGEAFGITSREQDDEVVGSLFAQIGVIFKPLSEIEF